MLPAAQFQLNQAGIDELKEKLKVAHEAAVRQCVEDAKAGAPVLTGALRDSISSEALPESYFSMGNVIGSALPYSRVQEIRYGFMRRAVDRYYAYLVQNPELLKQKLG